MITLKKASLDEVNEKEWIFVRNMPEDENGLTNAYHGISREDYGRITLPAMRRFAEGRDLPAGYVPETFFFLWKDDEIIGQFRIRHHLCESLRAGAGHIGYFIAKPFRGQGFGTEGLRLTLEEAGRIVPEEEIYLRVNLDNPASLHVMLNNGGRIVGQDEGHYFVRIPNPGKKGDPSAKKTEMKTENQYTDYSRKISERQWNLPEKGELESRREATYIDDIIQKDHIQRKLLEHLDGIRTVFDGGAGSGRFSILLAKQGCRVTHFDISQPMIDKAKELAAQEGVLDRITFVKGALENLSAYDDREFDLVMSFDAPVSYTWPNQNKVIGELVRIAGKRIAISVSSRLGSLPYLANPIQKNQFVLDEQADDPFVQWIVANREQMINGFSFNRGNAEKLLRDGLMGGEEEIAQYEQGGTPWCITYTFMPDELESILRGYGVQNIRLSGPGAYGRTIPREILTRIMKDPGQKKDFLDFCYQYDSNPYVCGMGKDNLLAIGEV